MTSTPNATLTSNQSLSPGIGNINWGLADNFGTFIVGTTFRISGMGFLTNMASGSTLGLILNHGTGSVNSQNLFTITFGSSTINGVLSFDLIFRYFGRGHIFHR